MIKLPFLPTFFPVLLLPLYWVLIFIPYYLGFFPIYLVKVLFSPYCKTDALYKDYLRKHSKDKRNLTYDKPGGKDS